MIDEFVKVGVGLFTGIVTVALISVIISRQSQTAEVIQATGSALSNIVATAVNPVHTSNMNSNLTVPPLGGAVGGNPGFGG